MSDKRDGVTKKPVPTQAPYFPQSKPTLPTGDKQPSQRPAPRPGFHD